jgi:hypothetical protein
MNRCGCLLTTGLLVMIAGESGVGAWLPAALNMSGVMLLGCIGCMVRACAGRRVWGSGHAARLYW